MPLSFGFLTVAVHSLVLVFRMLVSTRQKQSWLVVDGCELNWVWIDRDQILP